MATKDDGQKAKRIEIEREYSSTVGRAHVFCAELVKQLTTLLEKNNVSLAFPVQGRVKSWDSINNKLDRMLLTSDGLKGIHDLIGLRVVLLFQRHIKIVDNLLQSLKIVHQHNPGESLSVDQFGYSSKHYIIALPDGWLSVPTFSGMEDFKAEVQVRTLAQHMWAATSHVLQYKQESTTPADIRRALFRGAALIELLDLEFERILTDRDEYRRQLDVSESEKALDVDVLEKVFDSLFPDKNKVHNEEYATLLLEFHHFEIKTVARLREFIEKHLSKVLEEEAKRVTEQVERMNQGLPPLGTNKERAQQGIFFTHVGLARTALRQEFSVNALMKFWQEQRQSFKLEKITKERN